ncbi:MAG: hypothetical protein EBT83_11245 [Betaproteobacteria bacterium]|nr:hypothetical protein [Betaproteobacteria bacterium]
MKCKHVVAFIVIVLMTSLAACSREPATFQGQRFPGCPRPAVIENARGIKAVLGTDAGMHGLWDPKAFAELCDFSAWEKIFVRNETIEEYVRRGSFVPLYIHSDGAPLFEVRVGETGFPAAPTAEEQRWATKVSAPYLFQSNGALALSGIEYINGSAAPDARTIALPAGRWTITVLLLEPPRDPAGLHDRVPNFLVLANPESGTSLQYRWSVETFGKR